MHYKSKMNWYLFLTLNVIRSVSALGIAKEAPAILDYEDESLFDGKPVQHHDIPKKQINYRRQGGEERGADYDEEEEEAVTGGTAFTENLYERQINGDGMNHPDKIALNSIVEEIFHDAEAKVFEVGIIIDMHKAATSFEVGKIIGLIQAKYRHQMELWREMNSKEVMFGYKPKTRIWPAAWSSAQMSVNYAQNNKIRVYPRMNDYYILIYAMIFELERDIDNLIDMLLAIPLEDLQMAPSTWKISTTKAGKSQKKAKENSTKESTDSATTNTDPNQYTSSNPAAKNKKDNFDDFMPQGPTEAGLRHGRYEGNNDNYGLQPRPTKKKGPKWMPGGAGFRRKGREFEEERYKHRMREQYLLRKLGLNDTGHTPEPRFRMGWPIEETWDNVPQY